MTSLTACCLSSPIFFCRRRRRRHSLSMSLYSPPSGTCDDIGRSFFLFLSPFSFLFFFNSLFYSFSRCRFVPCSSAHNRSLLNIYTYIYTVCAQMLSAAGPLLVVCCATGCALLLSRTLGVERRRPSSFRPLRGFSVSVLCLVFVELESHFLASSPFFFVHQKYFRPLLVFLTHFFLFKEKKKIFLCVF